MGLTIMIITFIIGGLTFLAINESFYNFKQHKRVRDVNVVKSEIQDTRAKLQEYGEDRKFKSYLRTKLRILHEQLILAEKKILHKKYK